MKIVDSISVQELQVMADKMFGELVKADVDAAKRLGNCRRMETAFYRGMDLFNATADSWVSRGEVALPELLIAREHFANAILAYQGDPTLEKYFRQFAVAARMRQSA